MHVEDHAFATNNYKGKGKVFSQGDYKLKLDLAQSFSKCNVEKDAGEKPKKKKKCNHCRKGDYYINEYMKRLAKEKEN